MMGARAVVGRGELHDTEAAVLPGKDRAQERAWMVEQQLIGRGIRDERMLAAFREVPREAFVDESVADLAYDDSPLPIGEGQTISQPYVVALMIEALGVRPGDRGLEVGAGSGYAAAILSRLADRIYAIERQPALALAGRDRLALLGFDNVDLRTGDGTLGLPEAAPFDAILVSAGGPGIPGPLIEQLAPDGRLVIPVGKAREQRLLRITKSGDGRAYQQDLGPVTFVPLVGDAGWR
jgi:protein-L-isoaspartate(D-aspartate) O-methyltransferase